MAQNNHCDRCSERSSCREAFRQSGNVQGKSIVPSVLLAFVLPLLIFVVVLAVSLEILAKYVESVGFRTAFSLLPAIFASVVFVVIVKTAGKRDSKE
ncbi:MAG: hypothetical protein JW749_11595 [Sedimentisphaerales bacterium]|nr:hypothetical protein [Sedimentisphaerales bacterium]